MILSIAKLTNELFLAYFLYLSLAGTVLKVGIYHIKGFVFGL
jgi:hypothetical protein